MRRMFTRRFILLVGVLVAVNVTLWFAAPGLALRKAIVNQLFGSKLVRAQIHLKNGQDWNIDRGVITQVNSTQLTLREVDTKIVTIPLGGTTIVIRDATGRHLPLTALGPRWHVVVTWPAIGPAEFVDVEKIPPRRAPTAG
jgi:hypothetical protein